MSGKTLFPQTMGFLPWTTFERILQRHAGNHHVRSLRCSEQCRAMSFAQLTYRESLRDIETKSVGAGRQALPDRLPRAGPAPDPGRRQRAPRLARLRRFAQRLIIQARKLYAGDGTLATVLSETVCALDATTIDLCLSVFPWVVIRHRNLTLQYQGVSMA